LVSDICLTEVMSGKAAREQKCDSRWKLMMEKQDIEL
jgi:hypothetical protein